MDFLARLRDRLKLSVWPDRKSQAGRAVRRRALALELTSLEGRQLMAIASVTEMVVPHILPNSGKAETVQVAGSVEQVLTDELPLTVTTSPDWTDYENDVAVNDAKPIPSSVLGLITDQYRQDEPRISTTVIPTVTSTKSFFRPSPKGSDFPPAVITVRYFDYWFPVKLQAKANSNNRQYDITVFASDFEGAAQSTEFAFVPFKAVAPKVKSTGG